jgi:hypothetical protein
MKIEKTTTHTKFTQVQLFKGTKSVSIYSTNSFETYEEAVKDWEQNCRDRNKGDEYDAYWNAVPCIILQETTVRNLIIA